VGSEAQSWDGCRVSWHRIYITPRRNTKVRVAGWRAGHLDPTKDG